MHLKDPWEAGGPYQKHPQGLLPDQSCCTPQPSFPALSCGQVGAGEGRASPRRDLWEQLRVLWPPIPGKLRVAPGPLVARPERPLYPRRGAEAASEPAGLALPPRAGPAHSLYNPDHSLAAAVAPLRHPCPPVPTHLHAWLVPPPLQDSGEPSSLHCPPVLADAPCWLHGSVPGWPL